MAAAMDGVAGHAANDLIDWTDDPVIDAIVRPVRSTSAAQAGRFNDSVRPRRPDARGRA
jgi:hypothetical protein